MSSRVKETIENIEQNIARHHSHKGYWKGLVYPVEHEAVKAYFIAKGYDASSEHDRTYDQDLDWVVLRWTPVPPPKPMKPMYA